MDERKVLATLWCCGLVLTGLFIGYWFGAGTQIIMLVGVLVGLVSAFAGDRLRNIQPSS